MIQKHQKTKYCFIVGAGRSGSTLLYKILGLHPKVGYISNLDIRFQPWFPTGYIDRIYSPFPKIKKWAWFDRSGGAYVLNRKLLQKIIPCAVEGEQIYKRSGLSLDFTKSINTTTSWQPDSLRCQFDRMKKQKAAEVFISKRVANNRRLPLLRKAFPDAKFVHLIRDGRAVAYSFTQVDWWQKSTMVWWAGKTLGELINEGHDYLEVTARTWVEAEAIVSKDLSCVDNNKVLCVRYEKLLQEPKKEIETILQFIQLESHPEFINALHSLDLRLRPDKWKEAWSKTEQDKVYHIQKDMLFSLGYNR